uniref:NADH-ubiquinone oxidoreductase chain 4 n=1 Tax=Aegilops tauschii subsp. strangulata TaxID=200361 RepID=A0A453P271_AEGTS
MVMVLPQLLFLLLWLVPNQVTLKSKLVRSFGKEYITAFLIREFLMIAVSCMLDPLLFYVLSESVPIPMLKIKAAYQFFLYTLLGSVFMLLAILWILLQTGTTDLQILLTTEFSERRQILLWIAFFASFAVKVPMVPVRIWLPEPM